MLHLPFWKAQKPLKRTSTDLDPSKITEVEKASCRMIPTSLHYGGRRRKQKLAYASM